MPPDSNNVGVPSSGGGGFETRTVILNGREFFSCQFCQVKVDKHNIKVWHDHLTAKKHLRNAAINQVQNKSSAFTDPSKTGLAVSAENSLTPQPDLSVMNSKGNIRIVMDITRKVFDGEIQVKFANVSNAPLQLLAFQFLTTNSKKFVKNCINIQLPVTPILIPAGYEIKLLLKCQFGMLGHFNLPLSILLQRVDGILKYNVLAYFSFVITSQAVKQLAPVAPFKQPRNSRRNCLIPERYQVVRGEQLPEERHMKLQQMRKLDQYFVPNQLRQLAMRNFQDTAIDENLKADLKMLNATLRLKICDLAIHYPKFCALLYIEEMQQEVNIRNYDIDSININLCGGNGHRPQYQIKVAGLAEGRPSVLRGDWIYLKPIGKTNLEYQGVVHHVNLDSLTVSFAPRFEGAGCGQPGVRFRVRFSFNRLTIQLQQRAVQLADQLKLSPIIFPLLPTKPYATSKPPTTAVPELISLFDQKLKNNAEQITAVKNIVAGQYRPAPYIIFGPPGTGKTSTLVEAVKQTLRLNTKARLLLCAPSNNAADLLAQRLLTHVDPKQIFRVHALCRSMQTVLPDVLRVSNVFTSISGSKSFDFPAKSKFADYRVIITTLATAGRLVSAVFDKEFFTHVLIDEAGQATEPEALIAIAGLVEPSVAANSHLVLAGDCKQLGPVLQSVLASQCGLGISLIERLMTEVELYQRGDRPGGPYNSRYITKLLKNYRSHPDIFAVSSRLFYDNELIASADENERTVLCDWNELPTKGVPLIVRGVIGKDEREQNSPSYFNSIEIVEAMNYVDKLIDQGRCKANDIGIIAPYRKQVDKFRQMIRHNKSKKYDGMTVGSVEEFQGQERLVIIITTVRSSEQLLATDRDFRLGFVGNEKRFNTALTRAKALLIVIGNPLVLCTDPNWRMFIKFGCDKGAYTGVPLSPSLLDENAVDPDMEQLTIHLGAMKVADFEAVANIVENENPPSSGTNNI